MADKELNNSSNILRFLPSISELLQTGTAEKIESESGANHLTATGRTAVESLRRELIENKSSENLSRNDLLKQAETILENIYRSEQRKRIQRVINATGVIIHTNLGRAPLSENSVKAIVEDASRYCNLEYDLDTGKRGRRGAAAENLLAEITGAESALIVNNCAAACILVLTALCKNGEAIVSRGELVEIGGDFRIPDVMTESGAILREVGATNRTKISDYEKAVGENTKLIVKVHPSNYRIIGFTETPTISELSKLAHQKNILLYEDAGSGALVDLSKFGLIDEPLISRSIADGADVVTFSGDKLLGGIQAGLIVGKKAVIETLRKHPLYRALRASKITYAILEATLREFQTEKIFEEIPVLKMLALTKDEIAKRTKTFVEKLNNENLNVEIVEGKSIIGGGSAPDVQPPTFLISITYKEFSAVRLEEILRQANPPVIGRIFEDKFLLDLRTVFEDEEAELLEILSAI
ncbi:MAG: L-seryl-tRNA(Sec) selenium transferase [Pyrinomonadaceae bacterium]